ncbi:MAG: transposase [Clostridiales bacterium]|nr:transposase [Clostridiales bacterium]
MRGGIEVGYITGKDSRQIMMGIWSIEEEVSENSPARFIEVFADSLNVAELGFTRREPAYTGRPAYAPRDLIKLYMYGYLNGIRSSRKLERECGRNVELFYLLNRLRPDHNTIADFRKENRKALKKVFLVFVRACKDMKLMDAGTLCLDGTTIRAVNGKKKAISAEIARKKLEYAKAQLEAVERYLQTLDENDLHEKRLNKPMALDVNKNHLPDPEKLKERIAFHEQCLKELAQIDRGALLFTDPEAGMMPAKEGGIKACYNVQTAVDAGSHMIVDFDVTNNSNDRGMLNQTIEKCKQEIGLDSVRVIADKGYESLADIEECLKHGSAADVGFIQDREERVISMEYEPAEITAKEEQSTKPEDIQRCLHAGILPKCLTGGNIRIEVQELSSVSCFIRHEDGTVTCPMGRQLYRQKEAKYGTEYSSREACRTCPNRCTDSKAAKHVHIGHNSTYVPVRMYGSGEYPLQRIPVDGKSSKSLNNFGKTARAEKRVMIFIRRDISKQKQRQETSEHPFGTIKHYDGAGYFLCKGKEKVTAEYALSCLGYDIRRAITICGGVKALIQRFKRINLPKLPQMMEI